MRHLRSFVKETTQMRSVQTVILLQKDLEHGKVLFTRIWKSKRSLTIQSANLKMDKVEPIGLNGYRRFLIQLGSTDDG